MLGGVWLGTHVLVYTALSASLLRYKPRLVWHHSKFMWKKNWSALSHHATMFSTPSTWKKWRDYSLGEGERARVGESHGPCKILWSVCIMVAAAMERLIRCSRCSECGLLNAVQGCFDTHDVRGSLHAVQAHNACGSMIDTRRTSCSKTADVLLNKQDRA